MTPDTLRTEIANIILPADIGNGISIYHYTDSKAVLSMLAEDEVWLTQRDFMNDVYERSYANKILEKAFILSDRKFGQENYRDFINRLLPTYNKQYIFSTSLESDLMSQWAYYGGKDGYCLGFNSNLLISFLNEEYSGLSYGQVIYDEKRQLKSMKMIIKYMQDLVHSRNDISELEFISKRFEAEYLLTIIHYQNK